MSDFLDKVRADEGKKRRIGEPISKKELARLRSVSAETISNYYAGKREIPASWYVWAYERYGWSKKRAFELLLSQYQK